MNLNPILQIRQTQGLIGIDADLGSYSIRQPKAELHMDTHQGWFEMESTSPQLTIDSSKARSALTGGSMLEMNARIYSGIEQQFLQGVANRVQQGDRAAAIYKPGNTIAEIYGTDWQPRPFPETRGPVSNDNVEIRVDTTPLKREYHKGYTDLQVETHRPEISYTRGKLDIYMRQYASVQYIPPALDTGM